MTVRLLDRVAAEAVGTFLLVALGTGAIVAASEGGLSTPGWLPVAWFAAVTIPVAAFASTSGAHLNPALSLTLALGGRLSARELGAYVGSQVLGAFAGSAAVLVLFGATAHLGATVPKVPAVAVFLAEFSFSFLLALVVWSIVLWGPGAHRWRLTLPGVVVAVSTAVIGPWTGSSLNPARTIAPAVLSSTYPELGVYLLAVPLGAVASLLVLHASGSGGRPGRHAAGAPENPEPGRSIS